MQAASLEPTNAWVEGDLEAQVQPAPNTMFGLSLKEEQEQEEDDEAEVIREGQ